MKMLRCWVRTIPVRCVSFLLAVAAFGQSPETLARTLRTKPSPAARAAVAEYARTHSGERGALATLALAVQDIEAKQPDRAIAPLKQLQKRLPKLQDYVGFFLVQALAADQQAKEAAKVASALPASAVQTRALCLAAEALIVSGKAQDALELIRSRYSALDQPAGEAALAKALEASGDQAAAQEAYRNVFARYPYSKEAEEAGTAMHRLQISLDAKRRFERGLRLLDGSSPGEARAELIAAAPDLPGADRDVARVRAGAAMFKARQVTEALRYLRELTVSDPEADAERVYWAVTAARRAREWTLMENLAAPMKTKYVDSRWRVDTLATVGLYHVADENPAEAMAWFRACASSRADTPNLPMCQFRVAFDAYRSRKPGAWEALSRLVEQHPSSPQASAALYYLGRLAESQRNFTIAKSLYLRISETFANYYYATLARERLSLPALRSATGQPAYTNVTFAPPPAADGFTPDNESQSRMERAKMLAEAGLDDYAERELRWYLKQGGPAHLVAHQLSAMASQREQHDRAVRLIKGIFPAYLSLPFEGAPLGFWKLAYPLPWREDLMRNAKAQGLDPFLVAGLIRQESEFNPGAVSRAKAMGLMQVMPPTGREISRKLGIKKFHTRMLLDPKISLQMGTYHFRKWLDAAKGQVEVTLAAYNAGKTRADRWIARETYAEPSEFVEAIPFAETRDYVQAVLRNAAMYRRLYGPAERQEVTSGQ